MKVGIDYFFLRDLAMMRNDGLCFAEKEKSAIFALENKN